VRTLILAVVNPDNTPHGYNWTFAFPMLLFIIIGAILYLLFSRPHRRIPARSLTLPARTAGAPGAQAAQSAAVAGGLTTAPGGGTAESHLEPHGAHLVAAIDAEPVDTTPAAEAEAPPAEAGLGEAAPDEGADGAAGTEKDAE
jgi:hypothetical protein